MKRSGGAGTGKTRTKQTNSYNYSREDLLKGPVGKFARVEGHALLLSTCWLGSSAAPEVFWDAEAQPEEF